MSGTATSESWSAVGEPPDIIDLDKFMRGAVRPSRPDTCAMRDTLVVDAGGSERKPGRGSAAAGGSAAARGSAAVRLARSTGSESERVPPHSKRFSHDSGLSDDSYARRKHRIQRRGREARASISSLRAFRSECVRTLQLQQSQLARVAQLCERLSAERRRRRPERRDERRSEPDTSDASSSSRSSGRDPLRRDKHREECKTYKIIMTKLDELNRMFVARGALAAGRSPRAPPAASSASVSVSDKLVATEPPPPATVVRPVASKRVQVVAADEPTTTRVLNARALTGRGSARGGTRADTRGEESARGGVRGEESARGGARGEESARSRGGRRAVTHACALDIAPSAALPGARPNVATESVIQCDSQTCPAGEPRFYLDFDDPLRLYSQAKRLQVMAVQSVRHSPPSERRPLPPRWMSEGEEAKGAGAKSPGGGAPPGKPPPAGSWCALCRLYWRSLTSFCYPSASH